MTDFTELTVNLTDHSVIALNAAATNTGHTRTDTVNRAIQLYAAVTAVHSGGAGWAVLTYDALDGTQVRIEVNRPWWRFW